MLSNKSLSAKMVFLNCCLLFVVFIHSGPPFVNAQYLLDTVLHPGATATNVRGLATAIYHFTTDLHKKILESNADGNVFFSPTSIYVALAMLYAGSGGETKKQLASALHLEHFGNDSQLYENIQILLQTLISANKNSNLKMANRLYRQTGLQFKDDYLEKTTEYFGADLEALNFREDPEGSRSKINEWVSRVTSGKIRELFPRDGITTDTVLALANAVYFNASWLYKFDKRRTRRQKFTVPGGQKIQIPTMNMFRSEGLRYTLSDRTFRLLELPYSDEDVSMIIALDDEYGDFDSLLTSRIIDSSWDELVVVSTNKPVQLSLPKFNLQQTMNLKDTLGVKKLFESADLSGITESAPLGLSEAYHKAYIAVSEFGTEAAGATRFSAIPVPGRFLRTKPIDFIVDRAFLFLVVDKATGSILFFGHVKNPLKAN